MFKSMASTQLYKYESSYGGTVLIQQQIEVAACSRHGLTLAAGMTSRQV